MLRRRTAWAAMTTVSPRTAVRGGFFDSLAEAAKKAQAASGGAAGGAAPGAGADGKNPSPFPPGMDMQKLKTMADLFAAQPPEKQAQLMKQALDMQKMMSKVPGLKGISKMNTQVLEEIVKQSSAGGGAAATATAAAAATATAAHTFGGQATPGRGGPPTLDELKKVNLGPEIEALFEELRNIRKKKNEYRDLYMTERGKADAAEKAKAAAEASERTLRGKLKKAEQEVMLLTSENMEVSEGAKNAKRLMEENRKLKADVRELQERLQKGTGAGSTSYAELQAALQSKEDALRSLNRKVERVRRRDPLLHFSLCCSDVTRLCEMRSTTSGHDLPAAMRAIAAHSNGVAAHLSSEPARDVAEEQFAELQAAYMAVQQQAWLTVAKSTGGGGAVPSLANNVLHLRPHAAAAAYTAVVRRFYLARVPYANYDAVVTARSLAPGGMEKLHALFASAGFHVERLDTEAGAEEARLLITAAADTTTDDMRRTPGPFAVALAVRAVTGRLHKHSSGSAGATDSTGLARASGPLAELLSACLVTHAQPFVSETLTRNTRRVAVGYETARASGPGGQAVNVAETLVRAKLYIDQLSPVEAGAAEPTVTVNGVQLRVLGEGGVDGGSGLSTDAGAAAAWASSGGPAFAYAAEAQDSRSALQNRTSATEKLLSTERRRYNEGTLRSTFGRCDDVEEVLRRCYIAEAGAVRLETELVEWCVEAAAPVGDGASAAGVRATDAVLVLALRAWVEEAKA